jgi:hypothetical protein
MVRMGSDLKAGVAAKPGAQNKSNTQKAVTSQAIPRLACIAGLPRFHYLTNLMINFIFSLQECQEGF